MPGSAGTEAQRGFEGDAAAARWWEEQCACDGAHARGHAGRDGVAAFERAGSDLAGGIDHQAELELDAAGEVGCAQAALVATLQRRLRAAQHARRGRRVELTSRP